MKTPRNRTVAALGVVAGVAALALLVVFAVVLPKVSSEAAPQLGEVELPDELAGGWRALDLGAEGIPEDQVASLAANSVYADEVLDDIVEGGGESRQYVNEDLTAAPTVQVYGAEAGPVVPAQLVDPEAFGLSRPPVEVVEEGEVTCEVNWTEVDPQTQQPLPEAEVSGASCQRTEPGLTVRLVGGLDVDSAVAMVNEVWELNAA
ncbi:hypothetical protein GCM10009737_24780 [Nocardioides lentus]|uniref:Uncharacterized protein n=1 Tax=Nocardioides lentus TaxID=338077 RepID=A0ABN2PHV2_9ACTN